MSMHYSMNESLEICFDKLKQVSEIIKDYTPHDGWGWDLHQMKGLWVAVQPYLPCKEGDDVVLIKSPDCNNGWDCHKHYLKKGSLAKVTKIEVLKEKFVVSLVFYNESWIDMKGKEHPMSFQDRHTFSLPMDYVSKI